MVIKVTSDGYLQHSDDRSYRQHEHVRVAEEKLNRKLSKTEVVHHKDENKENNDPQNLLILRTKADHQHIHSKIPVDIFQTSDGSHIVVKQQRECPRCLRLFEPNSYKDTFCSTFCFTSNKTKNIPTASELQELVWSKPTTALAQELGVSDVAIGKWCTKLNVMKPPRGYWTKIKHNKV